MTNETRVVPVELKPCPFCGGKPEFMRYEGNDWIQCMDCFSCSQSHRVGSDPSTDWNARAQPAAPVTTQEPVGRYVEPGPRYKGAERIPQIRSYVEYPKESVAESNGYWIEGKPVYTHADAGEVERLRAERDGAIKLLGERVFQKIETLRAQLAEAHALLREAIDDYRPDSDWIVRADATLSASAEPSAPVERGEG